MIAIGNLSLTKFRSEIHNKCLDLRNLDRIIHSKEFSDALQIGKIEDIIEEIKSINPDAVLRWIKATLAPLIGDRSMRELRAIAQQLMIPYYSSKTKDELVSLIMLERQKKNACSIKEVTV